MRRSHRNLLLRTSDTGRTRSNAHVRTNAAMASLVVMLRSGVKPPLPRLLCASQGREGCRVPLRLQTRGLSCLRRGTLLGQRCSLTEQVEPLGLEPSSSFAGLPAAPAADQFRRSPPSSRALTQVEHHRDALVPKRQLSKGVAARWLAVCAELGHGVPPFVGCRRSGVKCERRPSPWGMRSGQRRGVGAHLRSYPARRNPGRIGPEES